ncbi:MAG: aconitate hydratase [Elusimicrobiota bacterium]|jgi:aconitate hydratase|nr:aconitate hydratase [Elusimicrobiota bacterium]
MNITQKIISKHLLSGQMKAGEEISLKIDQTLTQDATGTMAYLQFEAMGVRKVKTKLSVSYVDHNTLQSGFENADDHKFLQTIAAKYGIVFSPAGNGICHQVHLERFGVCGQTLIGADSHTPTAGGLGMLAFGAGGLDVAAVMAGQPFYLIMPNIVKVNLKGKLKGWAGAKDIILELLRLLTVKGGRNKIFEFAGEGVKFLTVPERATITNMGAELGAATSIFPSDLITKEFLKKQDRPSAWKEISADKDSSYDEELEIDLSALEPLIACPHSPDNVKKVKELKDIKVNQVCIGSCTNSSLNDMLLLSALLKGRKINKDVSLVVSPGSRQVLSMLAKDGALANIIDSGARILESACGPCIGMGQSPKSEGVSIRTFNRNFKGRSGTKDAFVYLASPVTAAAAALVGKIIDPSKIFTKKPNIKIPNKYIIDDAQFQKPSAKLAKTEIIKGPNIKSLPEFAPFADALKCSIVIKTGDNISTDDIMPAGAKVLPYRSNLEKISQFTFSAMDADFYQRAKSFEDSIIIGGENYGQGSSREHAALAPRFLGVKIILVKSFARIHLANLINFGIVPLTFENAYDYDLLNAGETMVFEDIKQRIKDNESIIAKIGDKEIKVKYELTQRQKEIIFAGGMLNLIKATIK